MRFWTKIFAVSFAMGVVSGIVLSYQFGTNWSRFSVVAGNMVGPLLGYEVLTRVFPGGDLPRHPAVRLQPRAALALCAVGGDRRGRHRDLGVLDYVRQQLDADAGRLRDAATASPSRPTGWRSIFNPSFPYRFAHMLNAAYLTAGFVVLAVGARYLLAGRSRRGRPHHAAHGDRADSRSWRRCNCCIGDQHGLNTLEHQPIKIAAMEAHWDGSKPGDFHIFAWPDEKAETQPLRDFHPARRLAHPHAQIRTGCSPA